MHTEPELLQRRSYPLQLDLVFTAHHGERRIHGFGRTIEISSKVLVIVSTEVIPIGSDVVVRVSWPVLLDGRIRLLLIVIGRISARSGSLYLLEIRGFKFVTRGGKVDEP